jgi:hypothetical protein
MYYQTFSGFDDEGDDVLYVAIESDEGTHLRYLDESELKEVQMVVTEWLEKNRPLMDTCACGAPLDSYQECERGEECGELQGTNAGFDREGYGDCDQCGESDKEIDHTENGKTVCTECAEADAEELNKEEVK